MTLVGTSPRLPRGIRIEIELLLVGVGQLWDAVLRRPRGRIWQGRVGVGTLGMCRRLTLHFLDPDNFGCGLLRLRVLNFRDFDRGWPNSRTCPRGDRVVGLLTGRVHDGGVLHWSLLISSRSNPEIVVHLVDPEVDHKGLIPGAVSKTTVLGWLQQVREKAEEQRTFFLTIGQRS